MRLAPAVTEEGLADLRAAVEVALEARATPQSVASLADALYDQWYLNGSGEPVATPDGFPPNLVAVLRSVHAGDRRWESGWRAERVSGHGHVVARRGNDIRFLERSRYMCVDRPGLVARPGDELVVSGIHDVVDPDRGWWRTAGGGWSFVRPPTTLVRLYWNVDFGALPELVGRLTAELDGAPDPWLLKCAAAPEVHARADATLLYLTPAGVVGRARALADLAAAMAGRARGRGVPMTLPVAAGLACAYDPGGGESFGMNRCRLVAEAVDGAGTVDPAAVVQAAVARFDREGIDAARPWARRTDPPLPWER